MLFLFLLSMLLLQGCHGLYDWQVDHPDNCAEEAIEDLIKEKTGKDIDLTPITGPERQNLNEFKNGEVHSATSSIESSMNLGTYMSPALETGTVILKKCVVSLASAAIIDYAKSFGSRGSKDNPTCCASVVPIGNQTQKIRVGSSTPRAHSPKKFELIYCLMMKSLSQPYDITSAAKDKKRRK